MMTLSRYPRFTIHPATITRQEGKDKVAVLDFRSTEAYYEITGPGCVAWQKMIKEWDSERIVRFIAKKYGRPEPAAARAFEAFVKRIAKLGLVQLKK